MAKKTMEKLVLFCILLTLSINELVSSNSENSSGEKKSFKKSKISQTIADIDHRIGSKNISYIVNPKKFMNYVEQFDKIKNLGEEFRCKLRGTCAEDLKRYRISRKAKQRKAQKKSMQSYSSMDVPDNSNQIIQPDRLISSMGPSANAFSGALYSNQPNAAEFGQQPQMNLKIPKIPDSAPMVPQGIPSMDQMQNAANDASIQNSIQSKMRFMDSANDQMMPLPIPVGGPGELNSGSPDGMQVDGMKSSGGGGHPVYARHHGAHKEKEGTSNDNHDLPSSESSPMNEGGKEEERIRINGGPRGVPNTESSSVSDEDIYKAEGVQPNEMKDLHNFLSHDRKFKAKEEEEESERENAEFNESERRHGESVNLEDNDGRGEKEFRGGNRSPEKDERMGEEHGRHSHEQDESEGEFEDKHHGSRHHGSEPEAGQGGPGEHMGAAGEMGPGIGMERGVGMGPSGGMGPGGGIGPGGAMSMGGPIGPGLKPGGVEVPTLINLIGAGMPGIPGMGDQGMGGSPVRPDLDMDNQGRFVSDNQRNMMESNSDYDVPKTGRKNSFAKNDEHGQDNEHVYIGPGGIDMHDGHIEEREKGHNKIEEDWVESKEFRDNKEHGENDAQIGEEENEKRGDSDELGDDEGREDNENNGDNGKHGENEGAGDKDEYEEIDEHGDNGSHEGNNKYSEGGKHEDNMHEDTRFKINKYKNRHELPEKKKSLSRHLVARKEIHSMADGLHTGDIILSNVNADKIFVPNHLHHGLSTNHNESFMATTQVQAHKRNLLAAFASLWKDYMLTTQSQLADKDPSSNNRELIHHPHHSTKSKVRYSSKEIHRWKKSNVEDKAPPVKRSEDSLSTSNATNETGLQTKANATSSITLSNNTFQPVNATVNDATNVTNSSSKSNNNDALKVSSQTSVNNASDTKSDPKSAKKSEVKYKPNKLPPIYLTEKNGEKLLVVHPTAEFIKSLPRINFTDTDDVKRNEISNVHAIISPLHVHERDDEVDGEEEPDGEEDHNEDEKANIVARSNIFSTLQKKYVSVPVIFPDPNGKIGHWLNSVRDTVFTGERAASTRSFETNQNFANQISNQIPSDYYQNTQHPFEQSRKSFFKQSEGSPPIPKEIQSLYQQYAPGDGKTNFQYAPSQDEVREELNFVERNKNDNSNGREENSMGQIVQNPASDTQLTPENDLNARVTESDSAPVSSNRDSQWDREGETRAPDGSKRSSLPLILTKDHVGFGPIVVEAKTADAPPDDAALDE